MATDDPYFSQPADIEPATTMSIILDSCRNTCETLPEIGEAGRGYERLSYDGEIIWNADELKKVKSAADGDGQSMSDFICQSALLAARAGLPDGTEDTVESQRYTKDRSPTRPIHVRWESRDDYNLVIAAAVRQQPKMNTSSFIRRATAAALDGRSTDPKPVEYLTQLTVADEFLKAAKRAMDGELTVGDLNRVRKLLGHEIRAQHDQDEPAEHPAVTASRIQCHSSGYLILVSSAELIGPQPA